VREFGDKKVKGKRKGTRGKLELFSVLDLRG